MTGFLTCVVEHEDFLTAVVKHDRFFLTDIAANGRFSEGSLLLTVCTVECDIIVQ